MSNDERPPSRAIELSVEVPGTPEQVWQAIATGPGISAWYVPTEVDEREGGAIVQDFGPGPEMRVEGRVARWEPPTAFAYGAAEETPDNTMFFEFFVEARDGGSTVVRLVNSGFGEGEDWDGQYDAMTEGWKLFLDNLRLHLTHFPGQRCHPLLVLGMADPASGWGAYTEALRIPAAPAVGDKVVTSGGPEPRLAGVVERATANMVTVLTSEPAPGVVFFASEGPTLSLFAYLYGPEADAFMTEGSGAWRAWMEQRFPLAAP